MVNPVILADKDSSLFYSIIIEGERVQKDVSIKTIFACPICGELFRCDQNEIGSIKQSLQEQIDYYERSPENMIGNEEYYANIKFAINRIAGE